MRQTILGSLRHRPKVVILNALGNIEGDQPSIAGHMDSRKAIRAFALGGKGGGPTAGCRSAGSIQY